MKEAFWLLFLTNGRLNRRGFWMFFGSLFGLMFMRPILGVEPIMIGSDAPFILIAVIAVYTQFAVLIKRYHDLGMSGWWSILWLVPIANVWVLIQCGLFPGNEGENKYGNYRFMAGA